jgi:hypothetical protein
MTLIGMRSQGGNRVPATLELNWQEVPRTAPELLDPGAERNAWAESWLRPGRITEGERT